MQLKGLQRTFEASIEEDAQAFYSDPNAKVAGVEPPPAMEASDDTGPAP
jgi:hypothetical protein